MLSSLVSNAAFIICKLQCVYCSHVQLWEPDHKEGWAPKNRRFWIVVLEKTFESPLDCKMKPVNLKGNQLWIFIRWTDAEAEAPILLPPDVKSQLIGKDPDAGKDWRQKEKGMAENEMVRQHHWLNGHEFEQTLGHSEGQGSLVCCSPWGHEESDTTEWLNCNNMHIVLFLSSLRGVADLWFHFPMNSRLFQLL